MLKVLASELETLERQYPGISRTVRYFEEMVLPPCPRCGSTDTAKVTVGLVGRSINLAAATTKMKLLANGPTPGNCFCNACKEFFTAWVH